jgi:hypothetical protein
VALGRSGATERTQSAMIEAWVVERAGGLYERTGIMALSGGESAVRFNQKEVYGILSAAGPAPSGRGPKIPAISGGSLRPPTRRYFRPDGLALPQQLAVILPLGIGFFSFHHIISIWRNATRGARGRIASATMRSLPCRSRRSWPGRRSATARPRLGSRSIRGAAAAS